MQKVVASVDGMLTEAQAVYERFHVLYSDQGIWKQLRLLTVILIRSLLLELLLILLLLLKIILLLLLLRILVLVRLRLLILIFLLLLLLLLF